MTTLSPPRGPHRPAKPVPSERAVYEAAKARLLNVAASHCHHARVYRGALHALGLSHPVANEALRLAAKSSLRLAEAKAAFMNARRDLIDAEAARHEATPA